MHSRKSHEPGRTPGHESICSAAAKPAGEAASDSAAGSSRAPSAAAMTAASAGATAGPGARTAFETPEQSAAQDTNHLVWRGQRGHYEVWFLSLYHPGSRTGYWLRYTLEAPAHGTPYVELWFSRCDPQDSQRTFGIHRRFPLASFASAQHPFLLCIGDSELGHDHASGSLTGGGHEVSWELAWAPAPRPHQLLPESLYADRLGLSESLLVSPNHSIELFGSIVIDGQRVELERARGGQSHMWGRKHPYGWGWGRCNSFEFADDLALSTPASAVLETLSVRMRGGPVVIPLTVVSVYPEGLDGAELAFKSWLTMPVCRADFRTGSYTVSAHGLTRKVEVEYSCRADDMVRTEYVDPDGSPAYCHFAGAASCRLTLSRRAVPGAAWKPFRTFRTERGAQFEWAGRAGDSQVKHRHLRLED